MPLRPRWRCGDPWTGRIKHRPPSRSTEAASLPPSRCAHLAPSRERSGRGHDQQLAARSNRQCTAARGREARRWRRSCPLGERLNPGGRRYRIYDTAVTRRAWAPVMHSLRAEEVTSDSVKSRSASVGGHMLACSRPRNPRLRGVRSCSEGFRRGRQSGWPVTRLARHQRDREQSQNDDRQECELAKGPKVQEHRVQFRLQRMRTFASSSSP